MASSTTTTGNGSPVAAAKSDFDALKNDMKALRADLAALLADTGKIAQDQVNKAGAKARGVAEDAGDKAVEYRDALEEKVREHPFAAVGIALAAGFILASLSNRR
jgi:ElaB/YqjD/DUF883 family membrane-anchored ribosome-binding protein